MGASLLLKRWVGVGRGRRSTANNVPLSPLRLGCCTLLWSLLTHRRPMSRTISPGLPFIGCCASSDRSSLLNDNRQQLHSHACTLTPTNKPAHSTVLQENKHVGHPPARLLPWPFLFRKEDKYPHNRKSLLLMHFQQSTASITCIYLQVWIYSLPAAVRFVLNGKWKGLLCYCGNILTLCLASTPTNELYVCELFNKSAESCEVIETGGLGVSTPQWKEQFINCSLVGIKDTYNTILRWGEGIIGEARILFTQGVWVDTVLQECEK